MNPSTGIIALDELIYGMRPGDNVVWKVDAARDYAAMAQPFWREAVRRGKKLIYFRYAQHEPLVPPEPEVTYVVLSPEAGFEQFITHIHEVIAEADSDAYYVFDMFTDLVREWFSERMIGNFFLLTCPYLRAIGAVGYFGLQRNFHSFYTADPIDRTAQLLMDVYRYQDQLYIHPLKVAQRHSPTMYLLHLWNGDTLVPITDSATTAAVTHSSPWPGLQSASYRMVGMWDRRFMLAEELLLAPRQGEASEQAIATTFDRLVKQLMSRDPRVIELLRKYLSLADIVDTWKHTVGSGMIGGKSVGMLLARAVLEKTDPKWSKLLEQQDSFYVASDVFYAFLVENDCWWIRQKQKSPATMLDGIEEARARILNGDFPAYLVNRFSDMLDYFGQAPIVVRSSSLLEDAFGNAFAGKYTSVFCPNQGTRQQRLDQFLSAVREVYASSLSEQALLYRAKRGVLDQDEQMALLVQRVSGMQYGTVFYPQLAGVGLSFNPFVWSQEIDPRAGVLRLVFGLGTRAVERTDNDYTRIVALNVPLKRPEGNTEDIRKHSQKRVDYLDLMRNSQLSSYFSEIADRSVGLPIQMFTTNEIMVDREGRRRSVPVGIELDTILEQLPLATDMREMLQTLSAAYECPVEIEFTVNLMPSNEYRINLLQCRPFHIKEEDGHIAPPAAPRPEDLLLRATSAIIGQSRTMRVDRIIYVVPSAYAALPTRARYTVARVIGKLTRLKGKFGAEATMLMGPGRFGSTMPELGVPVTSAEIGSVKILCELDTMHEGLNPDLSLGTHFFHELAEFDMLYIGYLRAREGNTLNYDFFDAAPNRLPELIPEDATFREVIRVIDMHGPRPTYLYANHLEQLAVLFLGDSPNSDVKA
ncbi:MAG TPA: PEP/pyruvate-binding domain-containing protein [Polyangiaceae bacterium]|nr:PEP/pyruvate-binding domain-containing protein [Polyangiaceae bacterium]